MMWKERKGNWDDKEMLTKELGVKDRSIKSSMDLLSKEILLSYARTRYLHC